MNLIPHPIKVDKNEWCSTKEYFDWLSEENPPEYCTLPPIKPRPGEIYLYISSDTDDWRSDQHRWKSTGIKHLPTKKPTLTCWYFKCYGGQGFYRRAYILYNKGKVQSVKTLIHYVGNLENIVHGPHGNRKHNLDQPHYMTAKSQLSKQKVELEKPPHQVYKSLSTEDVHPALSNILLPRDAKQVSNVIMNERDKKLLSNDDVIGLYLLGEELPGFVAKLELLPNFSCILETKVAGEFLNDLLAQDFEMIFQYDTTFNLGNFFVSPVTFIHPYFQGNRVIPAFYLIHDTKKKEVHLDFWRFLYQKYDSIDGHIFVSDRESAIVSSIKAIMTRSPYFFCWNHIQQDVKNWVQNRLNSKMEDRIVYTQHIWDLLDSDDRKDFDIKLALMEEQWTSEFKRYFRKHLFNDILASCKWELQKHNAYKPRSGITINSAESFNAVLKRCVDNKEVKLQILVLTLYHLDLFYVKEILRGTCDQGNYKLKSIFQNKQVDPTSIVFPNSHLPLQDLPYIFCNRDLKVEQAINSEMPYTKFALAKMLVLQQRVRLVPEEQAFIVKGEGATYLVKIFPKESCSCGIKGCHHIVASKIAVGIDKHTNKNIKLTKIINKKRGYKSGKKKPQPLTLVEAPDDALVRKTENNSSKTILIPTADPESDIIKKRFLPLSPPQRDLSFSGAATSTPYPLHSNTLDFHKKIPHNQKAYKVFGREIYFSHLEYLIPTNPYEKQSNISLYLNDSILEIYPLTVLNEAKNGLNNTKIFVCETFYTSYLTGTEHFEESLAYFLKYNIADYDIAFFPLLHSSHIILTITVKKHNLLIYLDSLHGPILKEHTEHILNLYAASYECKKEKFVPFNICVPKDIPMQTNNYDCGIHVLKTMEMIIRGEKSILCQADNSTQYRQHVKDVLYQHIQNHESYPPIFKEVCKKPKLKYHNMQIWNLSQLDIVDSCGTNTLDFLSTLVSNYWDETSLICHHENKCLKNPKDPMLLCGYCSHWYHRGCEGFQGRAPKIFKCKNCKKN